MRQYRSALPLLTERHSATATARFLLAKRGNKVNTGELVDKQAMKAVFNKKDVRRALDTMIGLITNARVSNEEVVPIGFGKFGAAVRNEPKRINPQIQKRITVPKNVVATYMRGKKLKAIVANKQRTVAVGSEPRVRKRKRRIGYPSLVLYLLFHMGVGRK